MMVNYSQEYDEPIDPKNLKNCKACGLYLNQYPIFDQKNKASVFWVGLSAVQFTKEEEKLPLSPFTKSGELISQIEQNFKNEILFYKTNLVKCLPLKNNKIRYPLKHEMDKCYPNFSDELNSFNPSIVFLLGKQVSQYVLSKFSITDISLNNNFNYHSILLGSTLFIPIHHPSFILIYKRRHINKYITGISEYLKKISSLEFEFEKI